MSSTIRKTLVVASDFSFAKYHPQGAKLPYEATGEKLADEIRAREPRGLDVFYSPDLGAMAARLPRADYLVAYAVKRAWLDQAPHLSWIQAGSAGIDHFFKLSDMGHEELKARGIALTSAAGVTRIVIAEHVLTFILMFARGMHHAMRQQFDRRWNIFMADEAYGRTVGIIGLGEIGERAAQLCRSVGMRVIGTKRTIEGYRGSAELILPASAYRRVMAEADYLVLACSLSEETRGMVNDETLRLMKPGAVLINIARGEIVDEKALIRALKSRTIAGAGLDTFGVPGRDTMKNLEELGADSELWSLPNVIISPNNASATPRIYDYLADIVVENYRRLIAGKALAHRVI